MLAEYNLMLKDAFFLQEMVIRLLNSVNVSS